MPAPMPTVTGLMEETVGSGLAEIGMRVKITLPRESV